MARVRRKNTVIAVTVLAAVMLGAALAALASERVRCAAGIFCEPATFVAPPEAQVATTSFPIATTTVPTSTPDVPVPVLVVNPAPSPAPVRVEPYVPPPVVTPPPVIVPVITEEGPTTFAVSPVPLLVGGNVRAGESVPVSYLKVVNQGTFAARLTGFWIQQNGNAPTRTVIGLSTVDDKGESRRQSGGAEGSSPFSSGIALAPTDSLFQPGQMRLFTIKALMSADLYDSIGTQLKIDVVSLVAEDVTFTGVFPIRGTTWTLSP